MVNEMDNRFIMTRIVAPATMLSGLVAVIVCFVLDGVQHNTYARAFLCWFEAINTIGAVPHALLPDAGLETIAGIALGGDSIAKTVAIYMHTDEGYHRFWMSVVGFWIAIAKPELVWYMLGLRLVMTLSHEPLHWVTRKGLVFQGESIISSAPGRVRTYMHLALLTVPVLIGLCVAIVEA